MFGATPPLQNEATPFDPRPAAGPEGESRVDGMFGIFWNDHNNSGRAGAPALWAQAPKQQNRLWILDVDGTRLVILAGDSPNMLAQDQTDLDGILSSIQIG